MHFKVMHNIPFSKHTIFFHNYLTRSSIRLFSVSHYYKKYFIEHQYAKILAYNQIISLKEDIYI